MLIFEGMCADQYAANGYYTLIPDLFNGDAVPLNRKEGFDLMAWLTKGTGGHNPHPYEAVDVIVEKSIAYLKGAGFTKIGAVGYCFVSFPSPLPPPSSLPSPYFQMQNTDRFYTQGAKYVVRFMPAGKGIQAGFVAHPSFVEESELAAITGPLSIAAAETDQIFTREKRHQSEEILIKTKQPYQINLFGGVAHGFSVRCDLSVKVQKFAKEKAFLQAVGWFDEHLI